MRKFILGMALAIRACTCLQAQEGYWGQPALAHYRSTPESVNDLVHIKLDVRFDYKKCYLYGKEWVTLRPHFYQTDSLRLDAKGMDIGNVMLVRTGQPSTGQMKPLSYFYDNMHLIILLDRMYRQDEEYTIYIEYTSKPNELKGRKKNEKGLYFINPDSSEKGKPVQIWTEGEPESASVWFPTLDRPDQKATQEMVMTVPSKYVSLSNGQLVSQRDNRDGTRTDTWRMDHPHSSYLFMMAVGDFRIYRDNWHGREVSYYLEPSYAPFAKENFGETPEAIDFFSKLLGVDFPWNKYAQVVVRDYVSGAMENTTACVLGGQSTARELKDSYYSTGIEHELFHQWFGDYVTAKNWSNLTLNESMADLGEILWLEHRYGQDAADEHVYQGMQGYFNNGDNVSKKLVEYDYELPKDVFNGVTYQKGGRILNMLRHYLGNEGFFRGLHIYLTENAFQSAEVAQLRLAMEKATGRDLSWWFDQWYRRAGHPILMTDWHWDSIGRSERIVVRQLQEGEPYRLPVAVDIYERGVPTRHRIWVSGKSDTLLLPAFEKPELVNFDAERVLVAREGDNKTLDEYLFQYFHAPAYADRAEAVKFAARHEDDERGRRIILSALKDGYSGIRSLALEILNREHEDIRNLDSALQKSAEPMLVEMAKSDSNTLVRAHAIGTLIVLRRPELMPVFVQALGSESYTVQAMALRAIAWIDSTVALKYAKPLERDHKGELTQAIAYVYARYGGAEQWPFVYLDWTTGTLQEKIHLVRSFSELIGRINDPMLAQDGIRALKTIAIQYKKDGAGGYVSKFLSEIKERRSAMKDIASTHAAEDAIHAIEAAP
jgi:aminopeptidase N